MPLLRVQVSGLWQYRQRHMQPVVHATTRTPGPSTAEPVVNEWRNPMSPVASASRTVCSGHVVAQVDPELERALRLQADRLGAQASTSPWNVRLMTSICCSRVSRTKFTAYPETRIVRLGYFSGWSIASISVSRLRTLMFMW